MTIDQQIDRHYHIMEGIYLWSLEMERPHRCEDCEDITANDPHEGYLLCDACWVAHSRSCGDWDAFQLECLNRINNQTR